jgi:hypothetical protein
MAYFNCQYEKLYPPGLLLRLVSEMNNEFISEEANGFARGE